MIHLTILDAVHAIGRRLADSALWNGSECTWMVMARDESAPSSRVPRAQVANGCLYQGTSGIALFLAEAASRTGDPRLQETALGAIQHALSAGREIPTGPDRSLHEGRVGIAWAATVIGVRCRNESLLPRARALLHPMLLERSADSAYDVISGAAGAIPALLAMAQLRPDEAFREKAIEMGDGLIRAAVKSTDGWSWGSSWAIQNARNLTGLAHGGAGCGLALVELSAWTGDARFLYAADRAFDYERNAFQPAEENWPDFRHPTLMEFVFDHGLSNLRTALKAGLRVEPYVPRCMNAWCHGAPGIGLSRCRAHALAPDEAIGEECAAAIRTTQRAVRRPNNDFSLCHGVAGNTELLRVAGRQFRNREAAELSLNAMREGIDRYERRGVPWPCGTYGQVTDPSLMLGEAGIGYALLREMAEDVPSVLLIETGETPSAPSRWSDDYTRGFGEEVALCARRSLHTFSALTGRDGRDIVTRTHERTRRLDFDKLRELTGRVPGPHREAIETSLSFDRAADEAQRAYEKHITWSLDLLFVNHELEIGNESRVRSTADAQVRWLQDGAAARDAALSASPDHHQAVLLLFRNRRIVQRSLTPFQAWLLARLQVPHTIRELAEALSRELSTSHTDAITELVRQQVQAACREGLIIAEESSMPAQGERTWGDAVSGPRSLNEEVTT